MRMQYRNQLSSKLNKDVWWNIISLGILAASGISINLVVIIFRGEEALGIFNQVYAIYIVLSQIGVFGLQASVLQEISYSPEDVERCAGSTISALLLVLITATLLSLVSWLLADIIGIALNSPGVTLGLKLTLPGLVLFCMNKVLINVLNGLQNMRAYASFKSLRFIIIPIAIVYIIKAKFPNPYLTLSLTITETILFLALVTFIFGRHLPLKVNSTLGTHIAKHIAFGIRGVLGGILVEVNTRIDVLMLGIFTSDFHVGIYSFAATLAEGFSQIPYAIRWSIDPLIGKYFAQNKTNKINELSQSIRQSYYPYISLLGVFSIACYPVFMRLFSIEHVNSSWTIFTIIMVGAILNARYRPFSGLLLQGRQPGSNTIFIFALVLSDALLNLIFIPLFGINGAAFITTITHISEAVTLKILAKRIFKIRL